VSNQQIFVFENIHIFIPTGIFVYLLLIGRIRIWNEHLVHAYSVQKITTNNCKCLEISI